MATAGRVAPQDLESVLTPSNGVKTIAVLGASYAGHRAVQVIAPELPPGWRIVVLERNTHAPHLYAFPRMTVVSGHERKVFIPYDRLFASAKHNLNSPRDGGHALIQASLTAVDVDQSRVAFRPIDQQGDLGDEHWLNADYIVYALGAQLSDPINVWAPSPDGKLFNGSKLQGVEFLQQAQQAVQAAQSVLVIGGGALGVQLAGDIAEQFPDKQVTLTHSRNLLPRFDPWMHDHARQYLEELGVKLVLGSRVDLDSISPDRKSVRLQNGTELNADLILSCLGQQAHTQLLPASVRRASGMAAVEPTLQLEGHPRTFVIGDAADAFGAINAGHTAWDQATVAGNNILRLIQRQHSSQSTDPQPLTNSTSDNAGQALSLNRPSGKTKLWNATPAAPPSPTEESKDACTCSGCDCALATTDEGTAQVQPTSTSQVQSAVNGTPGSLGLEEYKPTPPAIKVSVGLTRSIRQTQAGQLLEAEGGPVDLNSLNMWKRRGLPIDDLDL